MAVDASVLTAQTTGEVAPAPEAAPSAPPVETTETRGPATGDEQGVVEGQAEGQPAVQSKPRLADLLKDPDLKQEYDGTVGQKLEAERRKAATEAVERHKQEQEQARIAQEQQWSKEAIDYENKYRVWEDQVTRYLTQEGYWTDPRTNQVAYLEDHLKEVQGRRDAVEASMRQTLAIKQQTEAIALAEQRGLQQAEKFIRDRITSRYYQQPKYIQEAIKGKTYRGEGGNAFERLLDVERQADAEIDALKQKHLEDQAETKRLKAEGDRNLGADHLDNGQGVPFEGKSFSWMEDLEAEFAKADTKMRPEDFARLSQGLRRRPRNR